MGNLGLGVGHGARAAAPPPIPVDRPCARRACARHHPRLRRICGGVQISVASAVDHGQGLPAGNPPLQLRHRCTYSRGDRGQRRAGRPDPRRRRLGPSTPGQTVARSASCCWRHPAGPAADGDLHGHGRDLDPLQAAFAAQIRRTPPGASTRLDLVGTRPMLFIVFVEHRQNVFGVCLRPRRPLPDRRCAPSPSARAVAPFARQRATFES